MGEQLSSTDMWFMRPAIAVSVLAMVLMVASCGNSHQSNANPQQRSSANQHSAAQQHTATQPRSASGDMCTTVQRDLTTAMNDLQISGFSAWRTSMATGLLVAGASMTKNPADVGKAMRIISPVMSSASSVSSIAVRTVQTD